MLKGRAFEEEIASLLKENGIPFQRQVTVGGLQPDFLVTAPGGRLVVLEAKAWEKAPGFTLRAARQSELFEKTTGADVAYLVLKDLERSRRSDGVLSLSDLIPVLEAELSVTKPSRHKPGQSPARPTEKTVFAAMPFSLEYEDVFFIAMAPAAEAIGAACKRVDQEEYTGDVVTKIQSMIHGSVAVVADLSEARPNVLYEVGFAHALDRPTVHVCSTPLRDLPFDVSHWNTIVYKKGQTHKLRESLTKLLRAVVDK